MEPDKKVEVVDEIEEKLPDVNAAEEAARIAGWKPKEEYDGDKRWVDAEEFLERQELYDGIHKSNRKVKKLEKVVETLMTHNKKIEEAAFQKALDALKQQKQEAAEENDVKKVVVIDEKIDEIKEKLHTTKNTATTSESNEVFDEWKEKNPWFDVNNEEYDEDLSIYANGLGHKLEKEHNDWSSEKILNEVAKQTKKTFEWKFKNTNRETPNKVSAKRNTTNVDQGSRIITFDELTPEAKSMYKTLVKSKSNPQGVMSAEEYLADYTFAANAQKRAK